MAAGPERIAGLETLDRVELPMRYLESFCAPLLLARPEAAEWLCGDSSRAFARSGNIVDQLAEASGTLEFPAESRGRLSKRLRAFQQSILAILETAAARFHTDPDAAAMGMVPSFADWAWRRSRKLRPLESIGRATEIGLRLTHLTLVGECCGAEAIRAAGWKDWESEGNRLHNELADCRRAPADMVSHVAALYALGFVLAEQRGGADPWQAVHDGLRDPQRRWCARLISRNRLAKECDPRLAEMAALEKDDPAGQEVQLVEAVAGQLKRVRQFSPQLVLSRGSAETKEAILNGAAARREVRKFTALWSPLDTGAEADGFLHAFESQLVECERRLFGATMTPRPTFVDNFLDWMRERFIFARGLHLPLTKFCLAAMVLSYNLLVLQRQKKAARMPARKAVEEQLRILHRYRPGQPTAKESDGGAESLELGDRLMLYFALEGLRRSFALDLLSNRNASWEKFWDQLDTLVQDAVLDLAELSPLTAMLVPELETRLAAASRWTDLRPVADDPRAENLREFAVSEMAGKVRRHPALLAGSAYRVLHRCLESGTLGGTLVVTEFFQQLFEPMWRRWDQKMIQCLTQPQDAGDLETEVAGEFYGWFLDREQPRVQKLYQLWAELVKSRAALDRGKHVASERNAGLLRAYWHNFSQFTTHGLRQRLWTPRGRRLLCAMWLILCQEIDRRFPGGPVPRGLDTGERDFDDVGRLAARAAAQLKRAEKSYRIRSAAAKKDGHPDGILAGDVEKEFRLFMELLNEAVGAPGIRRSLIVRRLLLPRGTGEKGGKVPEWQWDKERVDELAAG